MSKVAKIPSTDEAWDDGLLGADLEHAKPAPADSAAKLDEMHELQMISIRVPKVMIDGYKYIAERYGMRYQVVMKQALQRFVVSEMKRIANEMSAEQKKAMKIAEQDQPRKRHAC